MATLKKRCSTKCICWYTAKMLQNYWNKRCKKQCWIHKHIASINCEEKAFLSVLYNGTD